MNKDKIGKFLSDLRKEKKMTQEDLSKILYTSRENVSKWERGINIPTPDALLNLSKLFDVSVNEILSGKKKTNENRETVDNISIELLRDNNVRIKRITRYFIIAISMLVSIFLVYYFFNTYNTIHVYLVSGNNENFSTVNGVAIFSKDRSYIKFGKMENNQSINIESVEYFYIDRDNKEHTVIISNDIDYLLTSINGYNQYYSYSDMKYIIDNSFLKIKYNNNEDIVKLSFKEDMSNKSLFSKDKSISLELNNENLNNNSRVNQVEKYFKSNFKYDEDNRQYYKINNEKNRTVHFYYSIDTFIISVLEEYKDNSSKLYLYSVPNNELEYESELSNGLIDSFIYDIENKLCISGECKEDIVNYFKSNYINKIK